MDQDAQAKLEGVSVIGVWTYREMFDAICVLTNLSWKVDGRDLWLVKGKIY